MKLDGSQHARIAYFNATVAKVRYRAWNGAAWDEEDVATVGAFSGGSAPLVSLSLETNGVPHVVFLDTSNNLHHAVRGNMSWTDQILDSKCTYASVATDQNNVVHIAYRKLDLSNANSGLKYVRVLSGMPFYEEVDRLGNAGWMISLAVTPGGTPHVAHWDLGANELRHTWKNAAQVWQSEVIEAIGPAFGCSGTSIALDIQGTRM